MKAFSVSHPLATDGSTDIGPDFFLPDVRCEDCGEEWGAPEFWYPTINPPWIREWRYQEDGDHPVLSWKKFVALRKALHGLDAHAPTVMPGSAVGAPSGRVTRGAIPPLYFDGAMLITETRMAQLLKSHGIALRTAPTKIRHRGRRLARLVAIEPAVVNALAGRQRRTLIRHECATCGFQDFNHLAWSKTRPDFLQLKKDVLRDHPHLFVVRETGRLVVTDAFLQILREIGVGETIVERCGDFL